MNILAVDTFSTTLQVALQFDGNTITKSKQEERTHAQHILPLIERCMQEMGASFKELDTIAFGAGPGSFTGLRIACSVAQALGVSQGIPLRPVSNLQALAQSAYRMHGAKHVHSVIDARMKEVYAASFIVANGVMKASTDELVTLPQELTLNMEGEWALAGNGYEQHGQAFPYRLEDFSGHYPDCYPLIEDIVLLAGYVDDIDACEAKPSYVRNQVAWRKESG